MSQRSGLPGVKNNIAAIIAFMVPGVILALFFLGIDQAQAAAAYTIRDDATGGDCTAIGSWDGAGKTCTLSADLQIAGEGLIIAGDGVTLDGAGHSLTGTYAGYGVWISGRTDVTVKNLEITKFGNYSLGDYSGIEVNASANVYLTGNILTDIDAQGIYFSDSTGGFISGNRSYANYGGISLWQSTGNTLTGNLVYDNDANGIWLSGSSENVLMANQASRNREWGILLEPASLDNVIEHNDVQSNSKYGILLMEGSNDNLIRSNLFSGNGFHGVAVVDTSSGNQVYGNNFFGNNQAGPFDHVQAYSGPANTFNMPEPTGGNYFSDWTFPDFDGDGFIDDPYIFMNEAGPTGGQDSLPLAQPFACTAPDLAWGSPEPFWADYEDYLSREVSVSYLLENLGPEARSISVVGSIATNSVIMVPPNPDPVDAGTGERVPVTLKYLVPSGVGAFKTVTYVTALDVCGGLHEYPGTYPGS